MFRAGDRNDVLAFCQHSCERELRGRAFFLARKLSDASDEIEIRLEIFALKPRHGTLVIIFWQVLRGFLRPNFRCFRFIPSVLSNFRLSS